MNLDRIHAKALRSIGENRINMDDFANMYEGSIEKDRELIARQRSRFEKKDDTPELKEAHKLADIFEAIICEHGEMSEWFGENAMTASTSEYDDFINSIDVIVEFTREEEPSSHLGLAIDATYSRDVTHKLRKIKERIDTKELSTVKYFKSSEGDFRGELNKVPRVIVSADVNTVKELADLWMRGEKKALANHPIQFQILDQIYAQLSVFERYARRQDLEDLERRFKITRKIIGGVRRARKKEVKDTGKRDSMHEDFLNHLEDFRDL